MQLILKHVRTRDDGAGDGDDERGEDEEDERPRPATGQLVQQGDGQRSECTDGVPDALRESAECHRTVVGASAQVDQQIGRASCRERVF